MGGLEGSRWSKMVQQMCEDCGEKHAHFGEVGSTERKWCGPCAMSGPTSGRRRPCCLTRTSRLEGMQLPQPTP